MPADAPGSWLKLFQSTANDAFLDLVTILAGPAGKKKKSSRVPPTKPVYS
jgi:hypothetical protein